MAESAATEPEPAEGTCATVDGVLWGEVVYSSGGWDRYVEPAMWKPGSVDLLWLADGAKTVHVKPDGERCYILA
eukprot:SAG11_NODE_3019_length_2759_cov_1.335338_2_plen_74_part_00